MVQWGRTTATFSNTWITITMNHSYRSTAYSVIVQGKANDAASKNSISVATGTGSKSRKVGSFTCGSDGTHVGIDWIAFGVYT